MRRGLPFTSTPHGNMVPHGDVSWVRSHQPPPDCTPGSSALHGWPFLSPGPTQAPMWRSGITSPYFLSLVLFFVTLFGGRCVTCPLTWPFFSGIDWGRGFWGRPDHGEVPVLFPPIWGPTHAHNITPRLTLTLTETGSAGCPRTWFLSFPSPALFSGSELLSLAHAKGGLFRK